MSCTFFGPQEGGLQYLHELSSKLLEGAYIGIIQRAISGTIKSPSPQLQSPRKITEATANMSKDFRTVF